MTDRNQNAPLVRLHEIADEISREGHNGWGNGIRSIVDELTQDKPLSDEMERRIRAEIADIELSLTQPWAADSIEWLDKVERKKSALLRVLREAEALKEGK